MRSDFAKPAQPDIRVFGSDILFDGTNEVGIEHAGSLYRLKITRQGKLILNK
ncbi:hemin uptake protein HemP [Phyllobacterium sp. LjRoot231]|uniref:hemin uptake protein HemP n=1 Tax=Phyllobacterium sp. LjRoot231 TaxID=3342289 RepID=UPI003ED0DB2E